MNRYQLNKLSDSELLQYFSNHGKHDPENKVWPYMICITGAPEALKATTEDELRKLLFTTVRATPKLSRFYNPDDVHADATNYVAQAVKIAPLYDPKWFTECLILELQDTAQKGLWINYHSFEQYMTNYIYPNLPWTATEAIIVLDNIRNDPRYPAIEKTIKDDHNYDLTTALLTTRQQWIDIHATHVKEEQEKKAKHAKK